MIFKNKCDAYSLTKSIIWDSLQTVLVAHLALVRLLPLDLWPVCQFELVQLPREIRYSWAISLINWTQLRCWFEGRHGQLSCFPYHWFKGITSKFIYETGEQSPERLQRDCCRHDFWESQWSRQWSIQATVQQFQVFCSIVIVLSYIRISGQLFLHTLF